MKTWQRFCPDCNRETECRLWLISNTSDPSDPYADRTPDDAPGYCTVCNHPFFGKSADAPRV